jgi:glycosyltransferase involved in cell wall biosynthesis
MSSPFLIDLTHTSHTQAKTGIQRVAGAFLSHAALQTRGVTFDPYLGDWRYLERWECDTLESKTLAKKRGARWPLSAKLKGNFKRFILGSPVTLQGGALFVPEVFSANVAAHLPSLFSAIQGPRAALFHDAIALTHPEFAPQATLARFPAYLQELARFDGVATISDYSRTQLLEYWDWVGIKTTPPVKSIPLGIDLPHNAEISKPSARAKVLCVGTIEGRKNHLSLFEACELLWQKGLDFELHVIGLAQWQTAKKALTLLDTLKAKGRAISYSGAANDREKESAYQTCSFTVYPSIAEGFGLPVAESIARGKPCICLGSGALGEVAFQGGCLTLNSVDSASLSDAIEQLLIQPSLLTLLSKEARARPIRLWSQYVAEVTTWVHQLSPRNSLS